jgi:phage tail sheath protein FI
LAREDDDEAMAPPPPSVLSPGVYVTESNIGVRPIAAVRTGVAALVGATARGPVGRPIRLTSAAEFSAVFGRAGETYPTALAALQFFANGGREALVVRVATAAKRDAPRPRDVVGETDGTTGLQALVGRDDFELVLTPDAARMRPAGAGRVAAAAVKLCEQQNGFHLFEIPYGGMRRVSAEAAIDRVASSPVAGSAFAASYFPRVRMPDPTGRGDPLLVSPSGAVAGLYARTDAARGVWNAPAGTAARILGIRDLELALDDADTALLLGGSVNALRDFPRRGVLCWGARTLAGATTSEWRYVNVRRLTAFIERSLSEGLGWTVFEPSAEALWEQVRLNVSSFMHTLYRAGALQGHTLREAYFVCCGRDTMSETDAAAGRLILRVGFAPSKPAEFVIIQIVQKTLDA